MSDTIVFERTPITHAEGLDQLVGLYLSIRQGADFAKMPIDLLATFDQSLLTIEDTAYEVSVLSAIICLHPNGCGIDHSSHYEHWLNLGKIEEKSTKRQNRHRKRSISIAAALRASREAILPTSEVSAKGEASKGDSAESESVAKITNRIELIRTAGQNRWRVGQPGVGDARRADGALSGSYFNEEKDKCLCIIHAAPGITDTSFTITVSIPITQLIVRDKTEKVYGRKRQFVEGELNERATEAASRHSDQLKLLKERMAGMGLAKAIAAKQKEESHWFRDGEIIAALQTHVQRVKKS